MKIFEKNKDGKNCNNHLYVVTDGETWLIQCRPKGKGIEINACIRFEGEIPLPKNGYQKSENKQLTKVAKNIVGSLKRAAD